MPDNKNNVAVPAIEGGPRAITEPYGLGTRYGESELRELSEALSQNTLFYAHGNKVKEFSRAACGIYGRKFCVPVSSGTAAVHAALVALGVGPGDEVITSPITDMGSVIGIIWQNAVPVFADIDMDTANCNADAIESVITPRTKAILLVHIGGYPCDMAPILELGKRRGIPIIEDCAQSYHAEYGGKLVGTFTEIAVWSMNDFKHISAGEAGFILTDDESLAREATAFADKYYLRNPDVRMPEKLGMNYRMSELQGAVALAQLKKLPGIIEARREIGDALTKSIGELPGLHPTSIPADSRASYLGLFVRVDETAFKITPVKFAEALRAEGVRCSHGHIQTPIYNFPVMRNLAFFPHHKGFAFETNPPQRYAPGLCPNAEEWLRTIIGLELNEFMTSQNVAEITVAFQKLAEWYNI